MDFTTSELEYNWKTESQGHPTRIGTAFTFSGLAPTEQTTAQSQREEFASQFIKQFNNIPSNKENWHDLFWDVAQHTVSNLWLILS